LNRRRWRRQRISSADQVLSGFAYRQSTLDRHCLVRRRDICQHEDGRNGGLKAFRSVMMPASEGLEEAGGTGEAALNF
jgi:hypothetical protein